MLLNNGIAGFDVAEVTIFDCKRDLKLWDIMQDYENDREIVLISKENKSIDHRARLNANVGSCMAVNGVCQICGTYFPTMVAFLNTIVI